MSYLSNPTSKTEYGVVQVGSYINVLDGVISLEQDLGPNANVTFYNANVTNQLVSYNANVTGNLYAGGNLVITHVTPSAGPGISLTNVEANGYNAHFTVTNTGVLSLTAGTGISISGTTGNITIATTGTSYINVIGVTGNYAPTSTDEYIGVYSSANVYINLPTGIEGRVYIIKDEYGQNSGKIRLIPHEGEKIDNANYYIISVPYQSVQIVYRAGSWRLI